jgi:hypothetical protein
MSLVISVKRITLTLGLTVVLINLAAQGARYLRYIWGDEGIPRYLLIFDSGQEQSIPNWYSSFQLLLASILLATIAVAKKERGDRYTHYWSVLSIILLLMSIDEIADTHLLIGGAFGSLLRPLLTFMGFDPSSLYYFWVVPLGLLVLIGLLAYLRFLASLPKNTALLLVTAGIIYVIGALGMEALSGQQILPYGREDWQNVTGIPKIIEGIMSSIEEFLEMLGILVLIYALLSYIRSYVKEATVQVRNGKE